LLFFTGISTFKSCLLQEADLKTPPSVLNFDFLACDRFAAMDQPELLTAPTIIICGDADRMTPLQQSK
jgi:hypothetical protein